MRISIFAKGLLLVTVPLAVQLALIGFIARAQMEYESSERMAAQSQQIADDARAILRRAIDAETGIRGYVISAKPQFEEPFNRSVAELPASLDRLDQHVGTDAKRQTAATHIRQSADNAMNMLKSLHDLESAGHDSEAKQIAGSESSKQLMDELRADVDDLCLAEKTAAASQVESLEQSRAQLNWLLEIAWIASVVIMATLAVVLWRPVNRRFQLLKSNIASLASDQKTVEPLTGDDEIAQIDAAVRRMADQLTNAWQAIHQSTHETPDFIQDAPCGFHSVDANGTIIAMNRTELGWLGYQAEELIGKKNLEDLLTPESKKEFERKLHQLKAHREVSNVEYGFVRKDGTIISAVLNSKAVFDANGDFVASRTTLFDNTERKRAEQTIKQYEEIVSNVPLGLIVWRLDNLDDSKSLRLLIANPAASRLLGVNVAALVGKTISDAFPGISEFEYETYATVARSGMGREIGEVLYQDERVAPNYWHVHAFPLTDHCVGVTFENVTEQKRNVEEIRRLTTDLDQRVRDRTAELAEANHDLTAKNQEIEMFVYSVSHDLRSPLVNLQGFSMEIDKGCQALRMLLDDESLPEAVRTPGQLLLDGKMAKSVGFIKQAVLRLSGIIDALLRLSRAGRVEYRTERVDLNRVISGIVGSLQSTITEKRATVRVDTLPPVMGDQTALEQVFANLIGNALIYQNPDRPSVIEVGFRADETIGLPDGYGVFFLRDNGLGIADAYRQKVFQVFQRAHPGVGKGEGIGLAIVARIVERHRGRVWVESEIGQGSTFLVSLPLAQANHPAPDRAATVSELTGV
jgi:PAS domain S-box-containing protein